MSQGKITCSACSYVFAVPANARAAICPRCGQALPVFFGSIEPTEMPPLPPKGKKKRKKEPADQSGAQLARIKLKKQPTRSGAMPKLPSDILPASGAPDFSTIPDGPPGMPDLPPLPSGRRPPPGPPLPPGVRSPGPVPIETGDHHSDQEVTVGESGLGPMAATQMDPSAYPASGGPADVDFNDTDRKLPAMQAVRQGDFDDDEPTEAALPPLVEPSLVTTAAPPARAPTLPFGADALTTPRHPVAPPLAGIPTLDRGERRDLGGMPVPPAGVPAYGQPPPQGPPQPAMSPPAAPMAPVPGPVQGGDGAPMNLDDTGIMVVVPDEPVEEVQVGGGRSNEPPPAAMPPVAVSSLAPISKAPSKQIGAGHGVALKEDELAPTTMPVVRGSKRMLYLAIGIAGVAVVAIVIALVLIFSR